MNSGIQAYLDYLSETHAEECLKVLAHYPRPVFYPHVPSGARSFIGSVLFSELQKPFCIILPDRKRLEESLEEHAFYSNINKLNEIDSYLIYLPEIDYFSLLEEEKTPEENDEFFFFFEKLLRKIKQKSPFIVLTQGSAFSQKFPLNLRENITTLQLKVGQNADLAKIQQYFIRMGYRKVKTVYEPGDFCVKGSLLDLFPYYRDFPLRLALWDEVIEKISEFNVHSQLSGRELNKKEIVRVIPRFTKNSLLDNVDPTTLILLKQLLPQDTIYIVEEYDTIITNLNEFNKNIQDLEQKSPEKDTISLRDLYVDPNQIRQDLLEKGNVFLGGFYRPGKDKVLLQRNPVHVEKTEWKSAPEEIHEYKGLKKYLQSKSSGESVLIVCDHASQTQRLSRILKEDQFGVINLDQPQISHQPYIMQSRFSGEIALATGYLHHGFYSNITDNLVLSDREIFGRFQPERMLKIVPQKGRIIRELSELTPGDYIVHIDFGIGIFRGLVQEFIESSLQEFIKLEYARRDEVYVPVMDLNKLQKYISPTDEYVPELTSLGTGQWGRQKKRILEDVGKTARYLIQLEARRKATKGYVFSSDDHVQREFEGEFIYDETPDQLKAIDEVKKDMEQPFPMERLLCGDVGFGKTEVAMRAAFKCFREGKQVAVLAPTTVLAHQHYLTFTERFRNFSASISLLSGLQKGIQQKKTLIDIKEHRTNIVIGTHRLLSKDVLFDDLGLLIIDEEQRFGVKQKEKLKEIKTNVDMLYLSATPIPRTLYMALKGLRDVSLIQTPPVNRLPIISRVYYWSEDILKTAILREIHRGGQVYYLFNRVEMIATRVDYLRRLLPRVSIDFIHAKMTKSKVQDSMLKFVRGEFQVLVATTIIENGLDIPNVNTLIIEGAEKFGLAQLYQIRGRIGRRYTQAFAHFFIMSENPTKRARQRLEIIRQIDHLGSGLEIARKDLQIRGAGSLLGKKQHGNMLQIGVETYAELLRQELKRLHQQYSRLDFDVSISWTKPSYIPDSYIEDDIERYRLYKRISQVENRHHLQGINSELKDRYGNPPREVKNLLLLSQIKYSCKKALIFRLYFDSHKLSLEFARDIDASIIQSFAQEFKDHILSIKIWNLRKFCIKLNLIQGHILLKMVRYFI